MQGDNTSKQSTKIEFDVNLTCKNCAIKIQDVLSTFAGIDSFSIDLEKQSVIVETALPSQTIKEAVESTGKRAVLKGYGVSQLGSAVAELKTSNILGVIRFHQVGEELCVIDGTIDGLTPGEHGLHVHEYGDLSDGCNNIGSHFNPMHSQHGGPMSEDRHYGDLGNICANENGRASFHMEDPKLKVWDVIGRSVAVTSDRDDLGQGQNEASKINGNSGESLACAIIARSAGLFGNPKRICQCDGVSVWDEQNIPTASL